MAKKEKLWAKADFDKLKETELSKEQLKLRHDLRYACFRVQKELLEGTECPKKIKDLAKKVEKVQGFDSWKNFAVTWDVSTPDPITIVSRLWSIQQEHDQMMERVALKLPPVK